MGQQKQVDLEALKQALKPVPSHTPQAQNPQAAWQGAQHIGPAQITDRYVPKEGNNSLLDVISGLLGEQRPPSANAQDPFGVDAFIQSGNSPNPTAPPMFAASIDGLYSRLDKAASTLPSKAMAPQQALNLLKKSGVKEEELAYRKLPEFLATQKALGKNEIQAHLANNPLDVNVDVRGGGAKAFRVVPTEEFYVGSTNFPPFAVVSADGRPISYHETAQAAQEGIDELPSMGIYGTGSRTKHDKYTVPGGENYKETLLQLPKAAQQRSKGFTIRPSTYEPGEWVVVDDFGNTIASAGDERMANEYGNRFLTNDRGVSPYQTSEPNFTHAHWGDTPNVVAHSRSNERELPGLGRGKFIEEVQSDWHQKGKAGGYALPSAEKQKLEQEYKAGINRLYDLRQNRELHPEPFDEAAFREQYAAQIARNNELEKLLSKNDKAVPDAPFKDTWPDLALKQQLMETAKDPSLEWMGFTGGDIQKQRYDLSKQISKVEFRPSRHGDAGGLLEAYDLEGVPVIQKSITHPDEIADHVGKEVAEKLLGPEGQERIGAMGYSTVEGLDLQVGGEGMEYFYDNLLPKRLEKIVKPFGGTVEPLQIPEVIKRDVRGTPGVDYKGGGVVGRVIDAENKELLANTWPPHKLPDDVETLAEMLRPNSLIRDHTKDFAQRDARQLADLINQNPMTGALKGWATKLTPEMKAKIQKEGLPLMAALLGLSNMKPSPSHEQTATKNALK